MKRHSAKYVERDVNALQHNGYDLDVHFNGDHTLKFTTMRGQELPGEASKPMTVEQAKFFLFGYHARCGR